MAPKSDKHWQGAAATYDDDITESLEEERAITNRKAIAANSDSLECVLQPRVLTDFSFIEQPVRCLLTCQGKRMACNGKSAIFMTSDDIRSTATDEFSLLPQADGSVVIQGTKTGRYLCSNPSGTVFASETRREDKEKWTLTESNSVGGKVIITSLASHRQLAFAGKTVHTVEGRDGDCDSILWTTDFTSGEICFLSMPSTQMRVRCDLLGNLSLSKTFQGWDAWRLSEAGEGYVRISPWAHPHMYLSSDDQGHVCTTEERGSSETWAVEKAPNGLFGVVIKSAENGRVLRYDKSEGSICTMPGTALLLDESCVWDLESLHRQTYYLVTSDSNRRLQAAKKGLGIRRSPGRLLSEEWTIQATNEHGVVTLFSNGRQEYLGSNESGKVFLLAELPSDGSGKWVVEEREEGVVVLSQSTRRVLVSPEKGPICTVEPGTIVLGSTRWKLEPKIPRQVSREKISAVGAAVAVGVIGTVATPFLIGGAIGILGIAHVGVAGEIAIGSIRAVEALNTMTRVTLSSSQLMISQSSHLSADSKRDYESEAIVTRPFCAWRSW